MERSPTRVPGAARNPSALYPSEPRPVLYIRVQINPQIS